MKKAVFLVLISIFAANLIAGEPKVELVKGGNRIDVVIAGEPFTSYLTRQYRKGYELPGV